MSVDVTSSPRASSAAPAPAPPGRRRPRLGRLVPTATLPRHLLLAVAVVVGVGIVLELVGDFRASQLVLLAAYGVAAMGLTLLTGVNGQISLGHGALMAVGGYTTALMLRAEQPLPFPVICLVAVLVTALVGALVGVAAARLHGPYLAGATLALAVALPGVALYFSETLGGEPGLTVRPPDPPEAVTDVISLITGTSVSNSKYQAYLGWVALAITLFLLSNLMRSRVGRTWRAVRDDEVAAELAGIDLGRVRVQAFVVSAACAGLAGAVYAVFVRLAAPSAYTIVLSLGLLAAIVIGGLGSMLGAVIGSAVLVFLPQITTDFGAARGLDQTQAAQLAPLVYGVVLVLVILVAPAGLVGTVRNRLRARRAGTAPARTTQAATAPTGTAQARTAPAGTSATPGSAEPDTQTPRATTPRDPEEAP